MSKQMSNEPMQIERTLIDHIQKSIKCAEMNKSALNSGAFDVPGFTSPKIRHLLNNLGKFPGFHYLEIGVHKGATFVAANEGNEFLSSIAVDNWSEFADGPDGAVRKEFLRHCKRLIKNKYTVYEQNCFSITQDQIKNPINLYLYDGAHDYESQKKALTHFYPMLADEFVFMVDDWSWDDPQRGTRDAIAELKPQIEFEAELIDGWWNGFYISLMRKTDAAA